MIDQTSGNELAEILSIKGMQIPTWKRRLAKLALSADTRADLYENLGILTETKAAFPEALAECWKATTRRGKRLNHPVAVAIPVWLHSMLGEGLTGPDAMRGWIPDAEAQILGAFQQRGLDARAFYDVADLARKQAAWTRKAAFASLPVLAAIAIIVGITYAASIWFFPKLFASLPTLRLTGQILVAKHLSDFMTAYGPAVLAALFVAPAVMLALLPRLTGPVRRALDGWLPPFTTYRAWAGTTWLASLAALLDASQDVHTALNHQLKGATPYLAERLRAVLARDDLPLGEALEAAGFDWPDGTTVSNVTIAMRSPNPGRALKAIVDRRITVLSERMNRNAEFLAMFGTITIGCFLIWLVVVINSIANVVSRPY